MKKPGNKKGFRHTEEAKRKMSINNAKYWLGKKRALVSTITRKKLSIAHKGKPRPEYVIKKIIASMPRGENHPNWKGGITSLREKIWHRKEYFEWRLKIFQRDNYICVICKNKSGVLNADHFPLSFSEILKKYKIKTTEDARMCKKLWDINNGRTLCLSCHRKTDNYGGRKK